MAGAAADRELIGTSAAAATFSVATPTDDAELRAFLRVHPTPGAVRLGFEREPDYFRGEGVADAADVTIVARRAGRIVCMGRCTCRELYLAGKRHRVGYLSELRLAPDTPRGLEVLRDGYAFFATLESARPADFYFTSVATTNFRARRVLASGRLGLPLYRPLAELMTVAIPVRQRRLGGVDADGGEGECGDDESALTAFLDTAARKRDLAMPCDESLWLRMRAHDLRKEDFVTVRRDGRIVAAAGLWRQTAWRQTLIRGYGGQLKFWRPWMNVALAVGGWPRLPSPGAVLNQACVHALTTIDEEPALLHALWQKLEQRAAQRGIDWLVAAWPCGAPELRMVGRSWSSRRYATQLYEVILPGITPAVSPRPHALRPEVGLL